MKRRSALVAIATSAMAGCLSDEEGSSDPDNGNASDDEPEVREPESTEVETTLEFGDWYERNHFGVLIEGVEFVDTVTLEASGGRDAEHEFDPNRMAIVDYQLKAIGADRDEYYPMLTLEAAVDDDVRELEVDDSEFEDTEVCNDYQCYSGRFNDVVIREDRDRGHGATGYEPGETRKCWDALIVSSDVDIDVVLDDVMWSDSS